MSMAQNQLEELKRLTKVCIDQEYLSKVHEMRKKLSVALAKEARLEEDLKQKEEEMRAYKNCHECHKVNVDRRSIASQTDSANSEAQQPKTSDEFPDTTATRSDATPGKICQNSSSDSKPKSVIPDIFKTQQKPSRSPKHDPTEPMVIELDDSDE